jgi:hypothetical protein
MLNFLQISYKYLNFKFYNYRKACYKVRDWSDYVNNKDIKM